MRIVFDTSVYVAAILRPGLSEELVRRGLKGEFTVITSREILDELHAALNKGGHIPHPVSEAYLMRIEALTHLVATPPLEHSPLRDPNDTHILACAKEGKANLIVSLDKDLLSLKEWEGVPIVHPKSLSWIVPPPT